MWVYALVFAIAVVFLVGSYLALGREDTLSQEQLGDTITAAQSELEKRLVETRESGADFEAIRKACSAWQLKLERLRDEEQTAQSANDLISRFSLLEWGARLKIQAEKTGQSAFAGAGEALIGTAAEKV